MRDMQATLAGLELGDEWEDREVPVDDLVIEDGQEPTVPDAFVQSVKRFGVMFPILVREKKRKGRPIYAVRDGRRRMMAAKALFLETVPVRILKAGGRGGVVDATLTLQANIQRASNPVAELRAIEILLEKGANEDALADATGLPKNVLRARMKLLELHPDLRALWEAGKIGTKAATAAARISKQQQKRLLKIADENGKVTGDDVADVRKVGQTATADKLDDGIFEATGVPPWHVQARQHVQAALTLAEGAEPPEVAEAARQGLLEALRAIGGAFPETGGANG